MALFAMDAAFSAAVLAHLVASGRVRVSVLVLAADRSRGFPEVRVAGRRGVRELASEAGLPVLVHDGDTAIGEALALGAPDFIAVACYPVRIGETLAGAARYACLNVHPSLLPRYRGPDPVFWQLRAGERATGVSVHVVDETFDGGPVAGRREVALPPGARRDEIDRVLAEEGARLLEDVAVGWHSIRPESQEEADATRQGLPRDPDFVLDASWPVERAFSFLRGAASPRTVFEVRDGRESVHLRDAQYWREAAPRRFATRDGEWIEVRFRGGVIRARCARGAIRNPR